ncbi:hypothetical protein [Embleya sp. AB8]|uniref:hypothetical protein n=1 Tax=Embleya sp. AB8 TaxID=3156304 RepID=UPI003C7864A0
MDSNPARHPAPLPGRIGHVAGVESLVLDGRRYYFGFDYRSDMIVSPLIDDPAVMAAFASEHLRQTDGEHDRAYWAELVEAAVTQSNLVAEDADREFDTAHLGAELPAPDGHLLYLLDAVAGWDESLSLPPELLAAYRRLEFDEDDPVGCLDHCLTVVRAGEAEPGSDEWTVVRFHLGFALGRLPGNWTLLFGAIGEGIADDA